VADRPITHQLVNAFSPAKDIGYQALTSMGVH